MKTNFEAVQTKLNSIINEELNIDIVSKKIETKNFFGYDINFEARDLIFLVHESEKVFNIKFTEDELIDEAIQSLRGLSTVIHHKMLQNLESGYGV